MKQTHTVIRLIMMAALSAFFLAACTTAGGAEVTIESPSFITTPPQADTSSGEMEEVEHEPVSQEASGVIPACTTDLASSFQVDVVPLLDDPPQSTLGNRNWNTDWTRTTINMNEVLSGGVARDGIPSIDDPEFVGIGEAEDWLPEQEPVAVLVIENDTRAYPLRILTWHEITNDTVCGVPVAMTFCPLCNSVLVFDRRVGSEVYEFGVSGLLRNSDLIMYDRTTESLWQQFTGESIIGEHAGDQLGILPNQIISFGDFKAAYPDGIVLSQNTGRARNYGINPYTFYDTLDKHPFLFRGEIDDRLLPMVRVVGVEIGDVHVAYPYDVLGELHVVNDTVNGQDLVIFFDFGTTTALGNSSIADSEDIGAATVFSPIVNGEKLTFTYDNGTWTDDLTGSVWNLVGQAISGELEGTQLEPLLHSDHFWFSWAAFFPETTIYGQ